MRRILRIGLLLALLLGGGEMVAAFASKKTSCFLSRSLASPKATMASTRCQAATLINRKEHQRFLSPRRQRSTSSLSSSLRNTDSEEEGPNLALAALFGTIGFFYWYWMVLGSFAASQGWPGIPEALPLIPGWPPSDSDLVPVLEDSQHFFYLSELLGNTDAPFVQPVRLAAFNVAESWIFAFLPALWYDPRHINSRWILVALWALLGINLTNAFLAPYLFVTELGLFSSTPSNDEEVAAASNKNLLFTVPMGAIASAVVLTAVGQCVTSSTVQDWQEMASLVQTDRTYLAFLVDLGLFSLFQPLILQRIRVSPKPTDRIPLIGLLAWLFEGGRA